MTRKALPNLQFAVLASLRSGPRRGGEIREALDRLGVAKRGPAFYRLMSRLEEAALVRGWYEKEIVDGQIFRERAYEATAAGQEAWERTRVFHANVIGLAADGPAA